MARMPKVRKHLREQMLSAIESGNGDPATLQAITRDTVDDVMTNKMLVEASVSNEANRATAQLRREEGVESIEGHWKMPTQLNPEDAAYLSARHLKRLRGYAKTELVLAHEYGLIDEAVVAAQIIGLLTPTEHDPSETVVSEEAAAEAPQQ